MSQEEEQLCIDYIKENFLRNNKPIGNKELRMLIIDFYKQLHPHVTRTYHIVS
jgi:hypothetical protein